MRKSLSRKASRRVFRAGAGVHPKNFAVVARGGYRG